MNDTGIAAGGATTGAGLGSGRDARRTSDLLVGTSAAMQELRAEVARIGPTDATILLGGPTGAGKDNVARAIHTASPRAAQRLEAVNCGAIPRELAEAELFGAEAGAYTGATRSRTGRIEAAHGGTLFLDEIGELPLELQVKLLRVLETREIERLGGGRPVPVDVRIIAATNMDVEAAVAEGRFRADLYWRLAVVWIDVPPLHARREDIPALLDCFARQRRQSLALTPCGAEALKRHAWPGNVRELRNFVERALAHGERCINADTVTRLLTPRRRPMTQWLQEPADPTRPLRETPPHLVATGEPAPFHLKSLLAEAEAALVAQALEASGGTIAASARLLGLKRTTLIEKMRRMGLKPPANEAA
ncbi:MAG: sigma-54 dependent transcriptional regulator [Sphingomonadaceae bacterium]